MEKEPIKLEGEREYLVILKSYKVYAKSREEAQNFAEEVRDKGDIEIAEIIPGSIYLS